MGIQDRDWWRESYAEKTGKVYNRANGRYSIKKTAFRPSAKPKTMHPLLSFTATIAIICAVWFTLKIIIRLAKSQGWI